MRSIRSGTTNKVNNVETIEPDRSDENLCLSPRFTGYHQPGGYAEYAVAAADFVYPLPDGIPAEKLSPLLCAGIIGYRAFSRLELPRGAHLGIYGFGASAHLVLQMAKDRGMRVSVGRRGPRHQDFARRMGADWVGGPAETPADYFDGAILFAPAGELVPPVLSRLDRGGAPSDRRNPPFGHPVTGVRIAVIL